jgi:Leucine-rich repeat (LRR) protein
MERLRPSVLPRPLAEIVQWLLQQHQQQRSAHNCPNDTPAAPQLLAATESLRDRWRNDAATLESLRELTTLDLSTCEIRRREDCGIEQYKERCDSDKLSILLDCMPQLTSLDLRNFQHLKGQLYEVSYQEQEYRDEICDAGLLEAIGKLTSLQVLCVGAVCAPKAPARDEDPDCRASGREVLAVLAGALKSLTRLTELKLTVGESMDAFAEGGEELFGAIAGLPALRILHMPVRRIGDIKAHSPAVARSLAGALSGLKELADLNLQRHKFSLAGAAISLVIALQSLSGLTHLKMGALEELPAELGALTGLQTIGLSGCTSLEKLPAVLGALTMLQEIDLSDCSSLKELPAELGALKELQKINLSRCKSLKKLPAGIGGLTALREMDLSGCKSLKELPAELGALKELQKINLSRCKSLEKLPDCFSALSELQEIDLSDCKSLKKLPAGIGGLTALREIDLSGCKSLKELPAELGALKELQKVDVSGCILLETLSAVLGGLTALREIDLSSWESLKGLPAELGALKELQKMNLSKCKSLEKLPAVLGSLTALREIDLSECNSLKELPAELGALKELQKINLSRCKSLEKPSAVLSGLTALREIDLSSWESLKELPAELGALRELQKINLSYCRSLEMFPDSFSALSELREIDLSGCESLKELPAELGALKELQKINLSYCTSLEKLPAEIGGLTALWMIDLLGCKSLKELPAELGALTQLQAIDLYGCNALHTPPPQVVWQGTGAILEFLRDLAKGALQLQMISLYGIKSLVKLPAWVVAITALREIDLRACSSLKELHAELGALRGLQKINLSGCKSLEELPPGIGGLTALREIDLSYCSSLKELPAELGVLTQLQEIKLAGCYALQTPPPHVVRQNTGAVLEFLRDLAQGDAPCHLIKVVLLGNQRAGKSSLADSLVLGRPVTRADRDRTVGIEVRRWPVGRKSQLVANIYDAAGQRVYRATHGLFMSAGALFLHVVRSDMPEEEAVETLLEWVEVVQQEAPGAVMGVVWTHIDCASATVSKSRVLGRVHEEN